MSTAGIASTSIRTYKFVRTTDAKNPEPSGRELSLQMAHSSQMLVSVTLANKARAIASSFTVQYRASL